MKKTNEIKKIKEYINFKLAQYARLNSFDYKQEDAKAKLSVIMKENLKAWTTEAMTAMGTI